MGRRKQNVDEVVRNGLCTGCGICENACRAGAIHMILEEDSHKPVVDMLKCLASKGCDRCLSCCPGVGVNLEKSSNKFFPGLLEEYGLGRYVALYTGYSCDEDIRFDSASGGMVTGFLLYLLEKGYIEGAVVTGFRTDKPFRARVLVATSREQIISAQGSKYCPVSLAGVYDRIVSARGRFVITGLPCHIHGFRKLAEKDHVFASKVFGYLGIYCSSTQTSLMPEYLLYRYKIDPDVVSRFHFRGQGNPGYLRIMTKDGGEVRIHYHQYYRRIRAFFHLRRCWLCADESAELADIAFGDIHIPEFLQDGYGVNSVIVRNPRFDELLHHACEDGYVVVDPVDKEKVFHSQMRMISMKKRRIHAAFLIRKVFFKNVPDFGPALKGRARLKDIVSVSASYFQTFIGRRRYLWFMVETLQSLMAKCKGVVREQGQADYPG